MPSTFTWLDYCEHERRRMLDVIQLFGERTTRDELGLGGIRDAFADLLFPGTSTIQTRARYFLFVPWGYLEMERKQTPSARIRQRGRELEVRVMAAIAESDDANGLIGRLAGANVQRLPSSVYWQGLATWGIRRFVGSQEEYHRSLDLYYARRKSRRVPRADYDGEAAAEPDPHNWHLGLPDPPAGFPDGVSFTLLPHEADYLRERVLHMCADSLLAHLLRNRVPIQDIAWSWDLASASPPHLREALEHGRNFSEAMHGSQLLYNLMLAKQKSSSDWIDHYRERLKEWWNGIGRRLSEIEAWDLHRFWEIVYRSNPRVHARARNFVEGWIRLLRRTESLDGLLASEEMRELVAHRELQLKGSGLARLRGGRALELWGGAAGAEQLDLRWRSARGIVSDILAGLEAEDDA